MDFIYVKLKDPSGSFRIFDQGVSIIGKRVSKVEKSADVKRALQNKVLVEVPESEVEKEATKEIKVEAPKVDLESLKAVLKTGDFKELNKAALELGLKSSSKPSKEALIEFISNFITSEEAKKAE